VRGVLQASQTTNRRSGKSGWFMLLRPQQTSEPFEFKAPVPLSAQEVVKLAPVLLSGNRVIGIAKADGDGGLMIWGTSAPSFLTLLVVVTGPGALAVRFFGRVLMSFSGGIPTFLDGADAISLLSIVARAVKGKTPFANPFSFSSVLLGLLRSMLRQGHGGTILAVPPGSAIWATHLSLVRYEAATPYVALSDAVTKGESEGHLRFEPSGAMASHQLQRMLSERIESIGY
jgi:hypothetical protein